MVATREPIVQIHPIMVVAFILFTFLANWVFDHVMTEAPEWLRQVTLMTFVVCALLVFLQTRPVWQRVTNPSTHPISSTALVALMAAFLVGAIWRIYFIKPRYEIALQAFATDAQPRIGEQVAGVAWLENFSRVYVGINNASTVPYKDLWLVLRPDEPVVALAQWDGTTTMTIRPWFTAVFTNKPKGSLGPPKDVSYEVLATSLGYRVGCDHLPPSDGVGLVAVVGAPKPWVSRFVDKQADGSTWMRSELDPQRPDDMADYYESRRLANSVRIRGQFTARGRRFAVDTVLPVRHPPRETGPEPTPSTPDPEARPSRGTSE